MRTVVEDLISLSAPNRFVEIHQIHNLCPATFIGGSQIYIRVVLNPPFGSFESPFLSLHHISKWFFMVGPPHTSKNPFLCTKYGRKNLSSISYCFYQLTSFTPPVSMACCYPKEKSKDSIHCTFSALYSRTPPLEIRVLENSSEQLHAGPMNPT